MSAIDLFASVDIVKGKTGEKRITITFNGKVKPLPLKTQQFTTSEDKQSFTMDDAFVNQ